MRCAAMTHCAVLLWPGALRRLAGSEASVGGTQQSGTRLQNVARVGHFVDVLLAETLRVQRRVPAAVVDAQAHQRQLARGRQRQHFIHLRRGRDANAASALLQRGVRVSLLNACATSSPQLLSTTPPPLRAPPQAREPPPLQLRAPLCALLRALPRAGTRRLCRSRKSAPLQVLCMSDCMRTCLG